jgi:very-short-patch-repair endonuclease
MTAYQNDFFGGVHRADPLVNIFIEKLRKYCPTPPFPKTEVYKIMLAEFLSDSPQMSKAIRAIIQTGNDIKSIKLIEAALRHKDIPAPDSMPRAMRRAREILEERGELTWLDNSDRIPTLDEMLIDIEADQRNIDSGLEARFHIALLEKFRANGINWLRPGYIENFSVDFLSSIGSIAVEIDGWEYHNDRIAFTKDRRKSRIVQRAGYTHLQYSGSELTVKGGIIRALDEINDALKWRLGNQK